MLGSGEQLCVVAWLQRGAAKVIAGSHRMQMEKVREEKVTG